MPALDTNPDGASASQGQIDAEMAAIERAYVDTGPEETQPRLDYAPYRSSLLRHPAKALTLSDPESVELSAPCFGSRDVHPLEADLTINHPGEPIGEPIVITGRILDGEGRPVRHQLVEIWQANAAGRYAHGRDQQPAPLDPSTPTSCAPAGPGCNPVRVRRLDRAATALGAAASRGTWP